MKTIKFEGTENQLYNLQNAIEHSDNDMPQEVKIRVYVASTDNMGDIYWDDMTDEQFKEVADRSYDLEGFKEAFNESLVSSEVDVIRFISVPV